jgi:hypothetical protein
MAGRAEMLVAVALVAGLGGWAVEARAQGQAPGQQSSDPARKPAPTPEEVERERQANLASIKPPLENLSEECRARCSAKHQAALDAIQRRAQAGLDFHNAQEEERKAFLAWQAAESKYEQVRRALEKLRADLLKTREPEYRKVLLDEIAKFEPQLEAARAVRDEADVQANRAYSRLRRAYETWTLGGLDIAVYDAVAAYQECVQGCKDGGGISTTVKVITGTAILGGIGVGISKLGGGDPDSSPGGTPPPQGGGGGDTPRNGTITWTIPFGTEVYRGQGPSGVDGTYRGFLPRIAFACPPSIVFPTNLEVNAFASGFGTGGGAGGFSGAVTGNLFNAQLNLNFFQAGAPAVARYVLSVPVPGQPRCEIVYEGPLPRQ